MKGLITTTAMLLAAAGLAGQVQARDHGGDARGGQQHSGQARGWQDRGGRDYHPGWMDRGHRYGQEANRGGWRDRDGWHDRDDHRWDRPYYRDYGYRYPRYYYSRPYYGAGWRYYYPPVYRSNYDYDCDDYFDYDDCYDDGFSLSFSLPLR
ncbi:MAG: hypothetical protein KGJ52_10245 [Gammaproteobacteria bacterium]|nr:hypothetical protein [Gammaproteobacteria bacterium]